jgi:hypothetical protein
MQRVAPGLNKNTVQSPRNQGGEETEGSEKERHLGNKSREPGFLLF